MENKLTERQRIEEAYHDNKYKYDDMSDTSAGPERSYYKFFWGLIGDVKNLKVLDFGCGDGWVSIQFAKAGAKVWGIDISGELVKKANKWAQNEGLSSKICFEKMPAENLSFPKNFFDLICRSAILHHTDLSLAVQNIHRVLKPGGRAIFIEPMNQNIFLQL
jgi:ubiquinone/menaquinone biosynthesis C-methylase UbiE